MAFDLRNIRLWKTITDYITKYSSTLGSNDLNFIPAYVIVNKGSVTHTYNTDNGTKTRASYYRIFSDGFCVQWGSNSPGPAMKYQDVYLGVKFAANTYPVVVSGLGGITSKDSVISYGVDSGDDTKTVSKFRCWCSNNVNDVKKGTNFCWVAFGTISGDPLNPTKINPHTP